MFRGVNILSIDSNMIKIPVKPSRIELANPDNVLNLPIPKANLSENFNFLI